MKPPHDPRVRLEDVADVEAFAIWTVDRTFSANGKLSGLQREEANDQALLLIFELHQKWDPARCAKFSAFLLSNLSKKLISWWRTELRQSGRGSWSGRRNEYTYFGTFSLDEGSAEDEAIDRCLIVAGPGE